VTTLLWNVASAVVALAIVAVIIRPYVVRETDRRFDGLTAGTVPADPAGARQVACRPGEVIPVLTDPPDLALIDAGLLMTGQITATQVTATLVDLANCGAIALYPEQAAIVVRDADAGRDAYERTILQTLAANEPVELAGATSAVGWSPADLLAAITPGAEQTAKVQPWFLRRAVGQARTSLVGRLAFGGLIVLVAAVAVGIVGSLIDPAFSVVARRAGSWAYHNLWPLLIVIILALVAYGLGMSPDRPAVRRTAIGRALTDRCEGFAAFIDEADPATLADTPPGFFATGLPWAMLTGRTDKWASVCARSHQRPPIEDQVHRIFPDAQRPPDRTVADWVSGLVEASSAVGQGGAIGV